MIAPPGLHALIAKLPSLAETVEKNALLKPARLSHVRWPSLRTNTDRYYFRHAVAVEAERFVTLIAGLNLLLGL